ncbi:MAG: beta-galactosidase [Hyphomonadaceae bacterium]|jgi:beta-galactosidase|nr:beta-galactosidase [Hyphomonadaceae bacterium]
MRLGVCYFPEHWPRERWETDAAMMVEAGISQVRIGEFSWINSEPEPGVYAFDWLEDALGVLHAADLQVMLCTPTATPPKWLVDQMPDMLAVGDDGRVRGHGSRRHYCFSHPGYRAEAARITRVLAERYGTHPAVIAWQTDNEFGCHDTVESYSSAAAAAFRVWLAARHGTIDALNAAWGNGFWSMAYRSFDEIDPPSGTVTEANPSHRLDWQRFSSDQVVSFHKAQADIIRAHSPGRTITHNAMGMFTAFDHFDLGRETDCLTWDSYPLGFLETFRWPDAVKARFLRQGHPDFTAFHHDLYRACGRGRWQVIEQQPGPVNWAAWNPAPLPGMVRAWTMEAWAHGAEAVSWFRWRQAPFAQEQMHAGLLRPDASPAPALAEARQCADDLAALSGPAKPTQAQVALIVDYPSVWSTTIQRQGRDFDPLAILLDAYAAVRRLGLDVDVVPVSADLTGYELVFIPHLPIWPEELSARLEASAASVIVLSRAGSKTPDHQIPPGLAPGGLRDLIDIRVTRVESLRPGVTCGGAGLTGSRWREEIESPIASADGNGLWYRNDRVDYLATWPDRALLEAVLLRRLRERGIEALALPDGLRLRRRDGWRFAVNYEAHRLDLRDHVPGADGFDYRVGGPELPPAGVAIWRE